MKRSLSFYTVFFIVCMLVMKLSGILSKIVLARAINPYEYGIITLVVISLPNMFQLFTVFCLYALLSHSKEGKKYFGFSVFYGVIMSLFIGGIVFIFHNEIFTFLNLPLKEWQILFLGFFIVLISNAILADMLGILRGLRRYSLSSILSSSPPVLKLFLILIAVYLLNITDFDTLLLIFALSPLLVLIGILIKEWRKLCPLIRSINIPSKDMFLFGISIFVVSLFGALTQSLNKIVVSHDLGVEYQGYFDVSFTLVAILGFSFVAMGFIAIPEATYAKNKKDLLFKTGGLGDVARALFSFLLFCVILLYFYSYQFVDFLFSRDYMIAADHVYILAIGYIFLFIQQFSAYVNISFSRDTGEYRQLILITLILLVLSPFVTHLLIQIQGFMGAYISAALFFILYAIVSFLFMRDHSPVKALFYRGDRLLASTAFIIVPLYLLNLSFWYGLILGGILYLITLLIFKYVDISLLVSIFQEKK